MAAKLKFPVETTYINTFVQNEAYGLSWTVKAAEQMRACDVDLVDVNQVLSTGRVYDSEFAESVGGLWSIYGRTTENVGLNVGVTVRSTEYKVTVFSVEKVTGKRK
ncbi:hypothetical protein D8770_28015 [Methylobacterium sp. DB1607]|nr:hypothetical protein [Methylobacterium sp. DB1607]